MQQLNMSLPDRTVEQIRKAVASGKYETAEQFVARAVEDFSDEADALDHFLQTGAQALCDSLDRDPSQRLAPEDVLRHLSIEDKDEAA